MIPPGAELAHYRIEALLGEGGMGQVYRAFDTKLHRRVALKVLAVTDAIATQRMVREARAAAAVEHPNKVSIFELGEVDGAPYITMELITGPTLRAMVGDRSLPWRDVLAWLLDVARALDAAHAAGLVHRDVKPENVMLREDGVVKVLDFGIARRTEAQIDPTGPTAAPGAPSATGGAIAGTAAYMAPEQLRGDALDGRCDQFAWGVMAFELFTGEHPWGDERAGLALVSAMLTTRPKVLAEVRPELPIALSDAVARALSSDRDHRFASMRALVSELAPLIGQSERGRPAVVVAKSGDDLASARTEVAPKAASTSSPAAIAGGEPPDESGRSAGRVVVALGVVALAVGVGVVALRARRSDTARGSSTDPPASLHAPPAAQTTATDPLRTPVYPCKDTKRPLPPHGLDRTCADDALAWCNQSMSVVACCAEGLIPEGDEGACGCPPAGAAYNGAGVCPQTTRLGPDEPRLAPREIQKVVRANFDAMRPCYDDAMQRVPGATGKVAIYFEIDLAGDIFFSRIEEGTLPDAKAQKCVLEVFRSVRFPAPRGGVVSVVYPINFDADGG